MLRSKIARRWPSLLAAGAVAICLLASFAVSLVVPLPSADDFNVARWELQHVPNKWLYLGGRLLHGKLSTAEENERLARYLELSARIDLLEADPAQADSAEQIAGLDRERLRISNDVEAIVEGRITSVLEDEGLESSLPLFTDARWVFPPVDVELAAAPYDLAMSPRDRIALIDERPLSPALSRAQADAIEAREEQDGARSALVVSLAGVATYPSIVAPTADYRALVETAAHEWAHHYLFFKPLGSRALASLELRTLNETVATIAGQQIAALVVAKFPLSADVDAALAALEPAPPVVDVGAALRELRGQVDALLAQGEIAQAESLMNDRQRELAGQGVYFRRINQAFFAFANIYATSPGSTDPAGNKLETLYAREGSVGAFLRAAAKLRSASDLDRLLGATSRGDTAR
jgi:hypothetical protein